MWVWVTLGKIRKQRLKNTSLFSSKATLPNAQTICTNERNQRKERSYVNRREVWVPETSITIPRASATHPGAGSWGCERMPSPRHIFTDTQEGRWLTVGRQHGICACPLKNGTCLCPVTLPLTPPVPSLEAKPCLMIRTLTKSQR